MAAPKPDVELIGLIPAAGQATRISPSPCSKEIFPVGFRTDAKTGTLRPKVVSHYLLEKMRLAGVMRAYLILRSGKWDIPAYFGDGSMLDMSLAYLMVGQSFGPPYTLDQAYVFVRDSLVAFGFPDILFTPEDAFAQLIARQKASKADMVLGLFPAHMPQKMDMVEVDKKGRVQSLVIKPPQTTLSFTWIMAVWTPVFTSFLHHYLAVLNQPAGLAPTLIPSELTMGHIIQAAVAESLRVDGVTFPKDRYADIGTPEDLSRVFRPVSKFGL